MVHRYDHQVSRTYLVPLCAKATFVVINGVVTITKNHVVYIYHRTAAELFLKEFCLDFAALYPFVVSVPPKFQRYADAL